VKLNVFGKNIPIIVKDFKGEDEDKHGYFDVEDKVIYIDTPNSKDLNLIIHEAVHSLKDRLHIQMDETLEEQLAQNFADLITDNFNISLKDETY